MLLVALIQFALPVAAQEKNDPATTVVTEEIKLPGIEEIKSLQQQATNDKTLTDEVRKDIVEQLQKAADHVTAATRFAEETAKLANELEVLPENLKKLEARLQDSPQEVSDDGAWKTDLTLLLAREKASEAALATSIAEVDAIQKEIARRAQRRPQLAELRATVAQQILDVEQQLKTPQPDSSQQSVAARMRAVARARRLKIEAQLLDQEARTYESTLKLYNLKRDVAERQLTHVRTQAEVWRKRVATARQQQAEKEAAAARVAAAKSHKAVRELAEENSALAARNAELVQKTGTMESRRAKIQKASDDRKTSFESLQERAEAANYSQAIGVLLRVQQSSLPNSANLRFQTAERQKEITQLNVESIEWEAERRSLLDIETQTQVAMKALAETDAKEFELEEIERQIKDTLTAKRNTLSDLIQNGNIHLDELVRLDSLEKRYADQIDAETEWLAEHVLWVRSTDLIGSQLQTYVSATRLLLDRRQWSTSLELWLQGIWRQRWLFILAAIPFLLLSWVRSRLKARLREIGRQAVKRQCTEFRLTLRAIGFTALIAAPFPALVLFLGWRTESFAHTSERLMAFGLALQVVGSAWFVVEFIRHMASPMGVGEAHLDWPADVLRGVRATGRYLLLSQLFPLFVSGYTEFFGDEQLISTYGRVAFLLSMIGAGFALWRLINPRGTVVAAFCGAKGSRLLWDTRWIWASLMMLAPVALGVLSAIGYHYTAVRLTGRVAATLGVVFVAVFVTSVLTRWLLVTYRRMAIQRSKERRRQLAEAAPADADQAPVSLQEPEVHLDDINQQVRKMIRIACGVVSAVALYAVWIDVMPAFGFMDDVHLWENHLVTIDEDQEVPWVTANHLLLFLLTAGLTLMASRNIPGLMEIAVLQRLPMDAGARYAASMISRYLIILGGFLIAFQWIGIGWSSVQWLVAAMTVGLGFGLQEIFANFVSGIILLFERPVRVGDTVTISGITGTVTRIQIRATTLLDWDNKELIVPNREFVTGHLINWTLSNPMLRLICRVGVAYGSDTRLATELLYKVAADEPEILANPEPVVVFEEFGDNSLNLELRVFVTGLTTFRRLRHKINMAIDDEFRKHGIEIAFPQRDLHLRSVPNGLAEALQQLGDAASSKIAPRLNDEGAPDDRRAG